MYGHTIITAQERYFPVALMNSQDVLIHNNHHKTCVHFYFPSTHICLNFHKFSDKTKISEMIILFRLYYVISRMTIVLPHKDIDAHTAYLWNLK